MKGDDMKSVVITDHAKNRMKERMGIKPKAQQRIAERAYKKGIRHADTVGNLKRYVDKAYLSYGKSNNIRIYGDNIFLFHNNVLLTVWVLPSDLKTVAHKIKRVHR